MQNGILYRVGILFIGAFLLWVGAGSVAYADHFPAEMVSATKHNLAQNPNILFGNTSTLKGGSEVCVFCHTPHGAGFAAGAGTANLASGMPPIWNRKINTDTQYLTYDQAGSPHFDGGTTLNGKIKGVSLACLSCHDGTIAFDALINLQGSGGYVVANTISSATVGDTALATSMFGTFGGNVVDANHTFSDATRQNFTALPGGAEGPFAGSTYTNNTLSSGAGQGASPFPNLNSGNTTNPDLRDDHPISFQIPCASGTVIANCLDPQFMQLIAGSQAETNNKMLYLRRDTSGGTGGGIYPQDKRDRIRAYPSDGGTVSSGTNNSAYIECASCHNPHTPRTLFLRLPSDVDSAGNFNNSGTGLPSGGAAISPPTSGPSAVSNATYWSHAPNQASAICLSCHQK